MVLQDGCCAESKKNFVNCSLWPMYNLHNRVKPLIRDGSGLNLLRGSVIVDLNVRANPTIISESAEKKSRVEAQRIDFHSADGGHPVAMQHGSTCPGSSGAILMRPAIIRSKSGESRQVWRRESHPDRRVR